jgi:anti-sigma regulatory factor (Ser/Thr protein kinase)
MLPSVSAGPGRVGGFSHPALFCRTEQDYLDGVGRLVRDAHQAGEPSLVAVPAPRLALLRDGLGPAAEGVEFADMTVLGRNPGRILATLQAFSDRHPGRPVRIVGEPIWAGRSPEEIVEATRHEALINAAFARRSGTILCPYLVRGLPEAVVADARRTHPTVIVDGTEQRSPAYTDPAAVCADCDLPLAQPTWSDRMTFTGGQLARVRQWTGDWAAGTELTRGRVEDLVLAVGEAAANSVEHGGGSGTLRLWTGAQGTVIAEVHDRGRLRDPLAGRSRPALASAQGGRGLWLINELCDLVEIRATADALILRMHLNP